MENNHPLSELMRTTLDSVRAMADANTIVGAPIQADGVTLIPVSKLSFGVAGGGTEFTTKKQPAGDTAFGGGTGRQTRGRLRRAGRPVMLCAGRPGRVPPSMAGPLFDVLPPDGGARRRIREPFGASSVFGGDPDPAGQGFLKQVSLFPVVGNRGLEGSWTVRCRGCAGRRTSA